MTDTAACLADVQDITAKVVAWINESAQRDITGYAIDLDMPTDPFAIPPPSLYRCVGVTLTFGRWRTHRLFSIMECRLARGDIVTWQLEAMAKEAREKIGEGVKVLPLPG